MFLFFPPLQTYTQFFFRKMKTHQMENAYFNFIPSYDGKYYSKLSLS